MVSRRLLVGATVLCLLVGLAGVIISIQQRVERCAYVPLLADELLPNANLAAPGASPKMPAGWDGAAGGVELGQFAVDGDGRAMQLIGIANYVQTPPIAVRPGRSYCFSGLAITDSVLGSTTRLRVSFHWRDADGADLGEESTRWQPVVLWTADSPPAGWSPVRAAFRAPAGATSLLVRIHPSSDDRVYLDAMHVRSGGIPAGGDGRLATDQAPISILPWPHGRRAAVAFTFDWETAMGGLIHSRSVDDPNFTADPVLRGMRMREGITTTIDLFRPYGVRATYYATGYNFLMGNTARARFMGDPTYQWANTANRWLSDRWQTTPWFAPDPYGTVQSDPAWYFGDLVPTLQHAGHDIQSHTFSHFYGGFVTPRDWADDLAAWGQAAAARDVPPAASLAFPWSSSGGMSDASWMALEAAGVRSVTRLSDQGPYNLFPTDDQGLVREPRCRPLPGHQRILACPDFYLTPARADLAIAQIERARAISGTIDLWAHTEEVTTPEQIAAWDRVVAYAARQPDLWVAPLSEIAGWQQALAQVEVRTEHQELRTDEQSPAAPLIVMIKNGSERDLVGLTLQLPFQVEKILMNGDELLDNQTVLGSQFFVLDLAAGQSLEVQAWPAP